MLNPKLKLLSVLILSALLITLSACKQTSNPPDETYHGESIRVFSGEVSDYTQGEATIVAVVPGEGEIDAWGIIGTMTSNGRFDVALPETPSGTILMMPLDESFDPNDPNCDVIVSEGVNLSWPLALVVKQGETYKGGLIEIYRPETLGWFMQRDWILMQEGDAFVWRFYVDADSSVSGTCIVEDDFAYEVVTYELNFKQGWNLVVVEVTEFDTSINGEVNTSQNRMSSLVSTRLPPSNVQWFFIQ